MKKLFLSAFVMASAIYAQMSAPAQLPEGVTRVASVEGITEYDLANGLRVLLFPDPSKATTTVNVTYLVGSRNESYGETGMAHLLEHLLFKGSTNHPNVKQELTDHGAQANGSTWYDRTNYFETFDGTDKNIGWALAMEADRMMNSFIARKDLDSEMTVVRNEFEMGENSPARILEERVMSTAYLWHNYGKSTIGARSDIEHVPIESLQAFYHRYYQPDNAVLTVSGHIDEGKALAMVVKNFGGVPKPARVIEKTYTEEPVQDGERSVTLRRVGDQKVIMVGVHIPALANADGVVGSLLGDALAGAPSGRLYKALVETKKCGLVNFNATDTREPGMLLLTAEAPKTADMDEIQKIFFHVLDDAETNPPTEAEVKRAKDKLSSSLDQMIRNSDRLGIFLSEFIAAGDWRLAFITRDRIMKATTAEVDEFTRTYLKESNRTVGLFVPTEKPERAEVPPPPDVAALVKDYKGGEVIAQGESFDPSPSNIDKRTVRGELQPGITIAFIPKKTRGEVVRTTFNLHFGDANSLQDKLTTSTLTASMLTRGTAKHTREQLTDELDKLKTQLHITPAPGGVSVYIETSRENLPAVMQLCEEILREPAFPESEFETLKQQQITALEAQLSEPQALAPIAALRHITQYPKSDIRYVQTLPEQIESTKAAKLDDLKSFYRDFYGASHADLAVVGDFDAEAMQKQVSSLFGGWKSAKPFVRISSEYKPAAAVNESVETPDKANSFFIAVEPVKLNDDNADYPAMTLANYMLGGGFMTSRLPKRIRDKEGLSYGVGSQLRVQTKDDDGLFLTYAISAPQNTAKVEALFVEEMKKAIDGGMTEDEVTAAKAGWLQSQQVLRSQDAQLVAKLARQAFWGRTMAFDAAVDEKVAALKAADVNAAMRKYLDVSKISIFKAGDFAKSKTPAVPPKAGGSGAQQ